MEEEKGKDNGVQSKWPWQAKACSFLKYSMLSLAVMGCFYQFRGSVEPEVKLADIPMLTFRDGEWTTGRRFKEVPQLQCVSAKSLDRQCVHDFIDRPKEVRCYNKGLDGNNKVVWDCKADFGFPQTDARMFKQYSVNCEGSYVYPDEYALKGSCYLLYNAEPIPNVIRHAAIDIAMFLGFLAYAYKRWNSAQTKRSTATATAITNNGHDQVSPESDVDAVSWSGALGGVLAVILWARTDILPISHILLICGFIGGVLSNCFWYPVQVILWMFQYLLFFYRQYKTK